ncbi:MAG: hypothetical protein IJL90_06510, partial [Lachnospiraceae bacterium]|nr:hypothetical protein [Lachnospiraceae bacterium]
MKKRLCIIMAAMLVFSMTACKGSGETAAVQDAKEEAQAFEDKPEAAPSADDAKTEEADDAEDFRIGIVTGSFSQS